MPFVIDTGETYRIHAAGVGGKVDVITMGVLDSLPADATQEQVDAATIEVILGRLYEPRTLDTMRRQLLQLWPLMSGLAQTEPAQFDAILTEYVERASELQEREDTAAIVAIRTAIMPFKQRATALKHFAEILPRLTELASRKPADADAITTEFAALLLSLRK